MKKKLALVGLIGFGVLFGCSQASQDVEADSPASFVQISKDVIDAESINVFKIKDNDTGCYYLVGNSDYGTSRTPSIVQMFIEKDGVSIPYCEK